MALELGRNKLLLVIAGPTAVGKTDLCLKLAAELRTEILSADSRQFYVQMNIGTAKPTPAELQSVKHYFINSHHITQEYSAGAYETDALATLSELFKAHDLVIATGGSGLYIRALCEGIDHMPDINPEIRSGLINQLQTEGLNNLVDQLKMLDPEYYNSVDKDNPQRVIRALEVCIGTNKAYSSFRTHIKKHRPFRILKVGLDRDRTELYHRIDNRMDLMLKNGLVEEVKSLIPYSQHNALQTVGYQEIFDFLDGAQNWEETVRLLKRNSRRYAKRQLTWFRKDPKFTWFHPEDYNGILSFITKFQQSSAS